MEPANVNPPPDPDEARLESLLRGAPMALPDDGFSTRVLAALPPPARTPARRSHLAWCTAAAALGTVLALVIAAPWSAMHDTWRPVLSALAPLGANLADPAVLAALLVATASAVYALRPSFGRRTT